MLHGSFLSLHEAQNHDQFRSAVIDFSKQLGFDTVSAVTVIDHPLAESDFLAVDNAPPAYRESIEDPAHGRIDPVLQHCKRQSVPLIWDQATYTSRGLGALWEAQAPHGYCTGVSMALHMPEGRHFVFGVDRTQAMPKDPITLTRLVADLQLFAVHAQDAALRLMVPPAAQPERPSLTPREVEVLSWTLEGRTAWQVGQVLGISERTAVLHISNAMHKLGCPNKHQAVLKALRLGLIR